MYLQLPTVRRSAPLFRLLSSFPPTLRSHTARSLLPRVLRSPSTCFRSNPSRTTCYHNRAIPSSPWIAFRSAGIPASQRSVSSDLLRMSPCWSATMPHRYLFRDTSLWKYLHSLQYYLRPQDSRARWFRNWLWCSDLPSRLTHSLRHRPQCHTRYLPRCSYQQCWCFPPKHICHLSRNRQFRFLSEQEGKHFLCRFR